MNFEHIKRQIKRQFAIAADEADACLYRATGKSVRFSSYQPAIMFEESENISGIAHHYILPDGYDDWSLEREIDYNLRSLDDKLDLLDDLAVLNPELLELDYDRDDYEDVKNILYGVTSAFNLDDIQFFLNSGDTPSSLKKRYVEAQAYQSALDIRLHWIPAPKTLQKIAVAMGKDENWRPEAPHYDQGEQSWIKSCRTYNASDEVTYADVAGP